MRNAFNCSPVRESKCQPKATVEVDADVEKRGKVGARTGREREKGKEKGKRKMEGVTERGGRPTAAFIS